MGENESLGRIAKWAVVVLLGAALAWLFWPERRVSLPPGPLAPAEPVQQDLTAGPAFTRGDYLIGALARFELTAKVLAKERYRTGRESDLSPIDLALGWGPMSDQAVVDRIEISQGSRWYEWQSDDPPVSPEEVARHSANVHIIPDNDAVLAVIKRTRVGEIIRLSGQLVEVQADDGWRWRSSLTRDDTGAGSCELFWVQSAERVTAR
jgi:hypothetical protein